MEINDSITLRYPVVGRSTLWPVNKFRTTTNNYNLIQTNQCSFSTPPNHHLLSSEQETDRTELAFFHSFDLFDRYRNIACKRSPQLLKLSLSFFVSLSQALDIRGKLRNESCSRPFYIRPPFCISKKCSLPYRT